MTKSWNGAKFKNMVQNTLLTTKFATFFIYFIDPLQTTTNRAIARRQHHPLPSDTHLTLIITYCYRVNHIILCVLVVFSERIKKRHVG